MSQTARLEAFRRLLEEVRRALDLTFGFRLWDGSRVPADWPADRLAIRFADEGAIARLARRPTLDTLIGLHAAGRIDLEGGDWFDLARQRPTGKVGRLVKRIDKRAILGVARRFLFAPGGAPVGAKAAAEADDSARDGSAATNKRNIAHHYDVSNAFYRLFLDDAMVYSCGYFQEWHDDIDRAQRDKLEMICRKLRLKPGERFLDIGCGWGALVRHAARHHGVEAHGVTLAEEQLALARERVRAEGLEGRVTLHLLDYKALDGQFDKIASIGMFEHVGLRNHSDYFRAVHRLLAPGGLYLHHAITRRAKKTDGDFKKMPREYKALVKWIFPGGELDHIGLSVTNLERHGFEVHDVEGWREHYQRTTKLWHDRLLANRAAAEREAGAETVRLWLVYLAGCSLAFERNAVGIFQTVASKRARGPAPVPPSRADLYR